MIVKIAVGHTSEAPEIVISLLIQLLNAQILVVDIQFQNVSSKSGERINKCEVKKIPFKNMAD